MLAARVFSMKLYPTIHLSFSLIFSLFLVFVTGGQAQTVTATITSANAPTGTLTSPHFVIDSDAVNADPAYNRDSIPGSVTVRFARDGFSGAASGTFRVTAQIVNSAGTPVTLSNANTGTTTLASDPFEISISAFGFPQTNTYNLRPSPAIDLGAGEEYQIRYRVQRFIEEPKAAWENDAGPANSAPFVVVHFQDHPEDEDARYVRGYLTGDATWVKTHALQTGTTTFAESFRVSVPYRHWRYDLEGVEESVELRFTVEMFDDLNNPVPLVDGGVHTIEFNRQPFIEGDPNRPWTITGTRPIDIRPTVQLDARNREYRVRIKHEHLEKLPDTYWDNGTSNDSSSETLLHFNGNLRFGSGGNAVNSVFSAYSNTPVVDSLGINLVHTEIRVTSGVFPGFPDYSYGDDSWIGVQLLSNGDAVATYGSQPVQVSGGGEVEADVGGVRVIYPNTTLSASGATGDMARVRLPQGLSYTPGRNASGGRYLPDFEVPGPIQLSGQFRHSGTLSESTTADAWVFDESRSLLYRATQFQMTQTGEIQFNTPEAEWVHEKAWLDLEIDQSLNLHQTQEMGVRYSNEGYMRQVAVMGASTPTTVFTATADGSARCAVADLQLQAGEFTTHFPLGATITMNDLGEMRIRDGRVTDDSFLGSVSPFMLSYNRACDEDEECAPDPESAMAKFDMTPIGGDLQLTSDGGIHGAVSIDPAAITWGLRDDDTVAHRSDEFAQGEFLASGNQLYQADSPIVSSGPQRNVSDLLGPAVITLAGYDSTDHDQPVYFGSSGYRDGVGAWPGATFTVMEAGSFGASRLADMKEDYPYALQEEVTKYYVRMSGLSGRHVAGNELPVREITLYGYDFGISRFQLTFLSNENEESWINGVVSVPYPSAFTQSFTNLTLTCTGALDEAMIDPEDSGPKHLAYWNGEFTPLAMRFAPEEDAGCYADRFLTLGLISGAANIETPLSGSLAFLSSGDIGTKGDNIVGVDCRLGLPATVPLAGPGNEQYLLNPVTKLYFNNHADEERPDRGFVSFAATCNVPFFQDLKLHVMTSAQADVPAPVYFASGWEDEGTFFSNTRFDEAHRGFPEGVSVQVYQSPSEKTPYVVSATQSIFGIVDLTYPLQWNPNARFFQSWEPEEDDLLVLRVEHQIDYLSAENAEITFGAQYDGLPSLNLVSAAFDAVDEQLGAARAITDAASSFVTDTLNQGVDELGNLVNDNMDRLLDEVMNQLETQVINPLYAAVLDSYQKAVDAGQTYNQWVADGADGLLGVFNQYFSVVDDGSETVISYLNQISDATASASSLITRVDDAVLRAILAIDSVAGQIQTFQDEAGNIVVGYEVDEGDVEDTIYGIIALVPVGDGEFERQIVQFLVESLIRELAPPEIAAVLNDLLADASSEVNAKLQELLEKFDPTLNRITDVLMEVRGYLVMVREKLQEGNDIVKNFEDILGAAKDEIEGIVTGVREMAETFIENMASAVAFPFDDELEEIGGLIDEFDKDEFVAMIRSELRDRLLVAEFVQQIQYVLRQYISEIDIAMRSAIDSAFGEVNRICKQLIKEALGPIDETINELIGDVNSVIGAGSVDGYAHIQGDTLRRLRLDAEVELKVPDEMTLQAYFEMLCYDSETSTGTSGATPCLQAGEKVVEVRIGALDVPLDWVSPDMRADLGVWFSMKTEPQVRPRGLGGSLTMTSGVLDFQSFKVTAFSAAVALGAQENYLAASARVIVSDYEASGGIFFGRTCSIEPLMLVDPDAAAVLGQPPFTGAYVYGEVWIPISEVILGIPASCLFRISAGVGAGAFYFAEGPTYGGRMLLGVSGEALCVVSIRGEVSMVGVMRAGDLRFSGRGTLVGKAGACPVCVKYRESAKVTYQDGSWSVDL